MKKKIIKGCNKLSLEIARALYSRKNTGLRRELKAEGQRLGLIKGQGGKVELGVLIAATLGICSLMMLQGCGMVKKVQAWPPSIEFNDGFDFHIGSNGINTVNNNRGIGKGAEKIEKERY